MTPQEKARAKRLLLYFKITPEEWEKILDFQGKVCYICRKVQKSGKRLATDHSHRTGILRGLLCSQCNRLLGKIENAGWTVETIIRCYDYLEEPPAPLALGRTVITFAGRLGTKRHRKHLKKEAKNGKTAS
jgi:hypothetical protein